MDWVKEREDGLVGNRIGIGGLRMKSWEQRVVNWGRLKTEFVSEGPEPRVYKNFFDFLSRI